MKQAFFGVLLAVVIVVLLIAWLRTVQQSDTAYVPSVTTPMWTTGGPAVAIDDAHWNGFTATRGYGPLNALLQADNYTVIQAGNVSSAEILANARVVVIANALGFRGVVRQAGQLARVNLEGLAADAFSDSEVEQLDAWVQNGGALLIASDPAPAGRAIQSLAERFGVKMRDVMVFDPEHSERDDPTAIIFTREGKTLAEHPIAGLAGKGVVAERVVTFGGQALEGPLDAIELLMLAGTAYELERPNGTAGERTAVAGLAQALALEHGRGRVVVLGDADLITSQVRAMGNANERIGLQWRNGDNELFTRRMFAWLAGAVK